MKVDIQKLHVAVLFASFFIIIGWVAPLAYGAYAPQSQFIEVHDFHAEDTTTANDTHTLYLDRTVKGGYSGSLYLALVPVDDGEYGQAVESWTTENRFYHQGNRSVSSQAPIPDNADAGTYQYFLIIEFDLSQNRIKREFRFWSEPFTITKANETTEAEADPNRTPTPTPEPTPTPTVTPERPKLSPNTTQE